MITSVYVFVIDAGVGALSVTVMPKVNVPSVVGFGLDSSPPANVNPAGKLDPVATVNV